MAVLSLAESGVTGARGVYVGLTTPSGLLTLLVRPSYSATRQWYLGTKGE